MSRILGLSLVILLASSFGSVAAAQETQLDEAARLTFESAREAFVAGDYETALARFRQAYQLSPRPGLLYNIAQSLDRLRRDEETVQVLREYLRAAPDAPNRSEVEARIRVLERSIAEHRSDRPDPDPGPGNPPPTTHSDNLAVVHPAVFLSVAGLAVASAAVLVWSGVETLSLNDAYNGDNNPATVDASYHRALDQQTLTNVFIGVTGALGAAAIALIFFTDWNALTGESSGSASIRPLFQAGPSGAWLGIGASF